MTTYKWKLVNPVTRKRVSGKAKDSDLIMFRAYRTLGALLFHNDLSKDDIIRDIERVKSHHGIVINNTGIQGKWDCRYYRIKKSYIQIWKSY